MYGIRDRIMSPLGSQVHSQMNSLQTIHVWVSVSQPVREDIYYKVTQGVNNLLKNKMKNG
jgi:hypothetical protein